MNDTLLTSKSNRPVLSGGERTGHFTFRRVLPHLSLIALAALLYLLLLRFSNDIAGTDLDPSWAQSLLFFLKHHSQFGKDVMFTYGPLGFLSVSFYDHSLFGAKYLYEVFLKGYFVYLLVRVLRGFPLAQNLFLLALVLLFTISDSTEIQYTTLMILICLTLLVEKSPPPALFIANIFGLAALSLVKFSYLPFALLMILLAELRLRLSGSRSFLSPLLLFVACYLGLWILLWQSLSNLIPYFRSSLELSKGYGEAMVNKGRITDILLAVFLFITHLSLLGALIAQKKKPPLVYLSSFSVLFGAALCLAWKADFTRQDYGHIVTFFGESLFILFLSGFLLYVHRLLRWQQVIPLCFGLLFGFWGLLRNTTPDSRIPSPHAVFGSAVQRIPTSVNILLNPRQHIKQMDERVVEMRKKWRLPRLNAIIGNDTVDVVSHEQGIIFLNGLNWRNRPAFQSYTAYTKALIEANEAFFQSTDAPTYLLFQNQLIDERYPSESDSKIFPEILRRYTPVSAEKGFLLLRRNPAAPAIVLPAPRHFRSYFDQEITLPTPVTPDESVIVQVQFRHRILGTLKAAAFRWPPVYFVTRWKNQQTFRWRILPAASAEGFILSPNFITDVDFLNLYGKKTENQVVSFRVIGDKSTNFYYRNELEITLWQVPHLVGTPLSTAQIHYISQELTKPLPSK